MSVPDTENQRRRVSERRRERYRLRSIVARAADRMAQESDRGYEVVPWRRQAACGRVMVDDVVQVRQVDGTAYTAGVSTCSSVWACAVCEAKIRTGRSMEMAEVASAHFAAGGGVGLLTLTARHDDSMSLAEILDAEADAWRSLQQDSRWRGLRDEVAVIAGVNLVGQVRSWEITQGFTSDGRGGWHPHFHVLLLWADQSDHAADLAWIHEAWAERMEARLGVRPSLSRGVDYRTLDRASACQYVTKIAQEMTRADLKNGGKHARSVWSLVEAANDGLLWAVRRWSEYVQATRGRRAIQFSRGLRALYGLVEEKSDEELAADDRDGELVLTIPRCDWPWYHRAGWGEVPRIVSLLESIEVELVAGSGEGPNGSHDRPVLRIGVASG